MRLRCARLAQSRQGVSDIAPLRRTWPNACARRQAGVPRTSALLSKSVDTLKVRDAQDVEQAVRAAIASEQPLEIVGHGSKRLVGQPMATNALLDLSALNAVTAYEPNELIITLQAGAPLADVLSLIDSKNQQF